MGAAEPEPESEQVSDDAVDVFYSKAVLTRTFGAWRATALAARQRTYRAVSFDQLRLMSSAVVVWKDRARIFHDSRDCNATASLQDIDGSTQDGGISIEGGSGRISDLPFEGYSTLASV